MSEQHTSEQPKSEHLMSDAPGRFGRFGGRYVPEALIPGLDQVRTAGVVTLPGAFIGVLLGGGSPAQAAAAQVLVLFGIMASQTVTAVVAERFIMAARLLPTDLRSALRP